MLSWTSGRAMTGMSVQQQLSDGFAARVAIVDDDLSVRRALARLLRLEGYQVTTFGSAEEFLSSGALDRVDCLMLDLVLGGMTGLDLHAQLVAAGSAPPTILITAHENAAADPRLRASSVIACLRKPIEDVQLLEAVDTAIQRRRA